jgi:stage II sporulation protein D
MKRLTAFYVFIIFIVFMMPILIISCFRTKKPKVIESEGSWVRVYDCSSNKIGTLDLENYIAGVVAAEMPASFHIEALKAQALAARTYTLMRMEKYGGKGCVNHPEADICTDSAHCQAYRNPKSLGKDSEKIMEAVFSTKGEVIVYEYHLIDAVFHSTSGGKTENSEDVWTNKVPYLRSVISEFEDSSPKLVSLQKINIDDFITGLKSMDEGLKVNKKNLKNEMNIIERSEGGRISKIKIGNKTFTGRAIREMFGLNSSNFNFNIGKNEITFTVTGYGHGIGMSQYGADGMARNGFDYKDIIRHYYQGVEIANIESFKH